ncbi:MAG: DNA gyrase subunit A [Candidatus Competibacterales bacterium]
MADFAKEVLPVNLEDEMRQSYLDYAMSVIVGRALPDVRDGLKPVHRRVLFAMSELGLDYNRAYKKSARVCGDTTGKYHPHGEGAVYDTLVRMAQEFTMRYELVDGQGNFGSIDGDSPAAMRYTEVRLARIAQALLADIDKDTVDFVPNYDESEREPTVFPARLPNLLVNGAAGIAVGMATNIPPHNLGEVVDACLALIDNPQLSVEQLMALVPGPDFPTGATISGIQGIRDAYLTGRGRIYIRAKTTIESDEKRGREAVIVNELPYQVNKARLIAKIADLVKEKKLEGISELRDESDKEGMRIYIEVKRGEQAEVVLNNLYQHTALQHVFGINMVALVEGRPRLVNLKEILEAFLRHRREVVTRRTAFELNKARNRAHVLEGLAVALANIDPMIELIKAAAGPAEARDELMGRAWSPGLVTEMLDRSGAALSRPDDLDSNRGLGPDGYWLSLVQAKAILDLQLQRLTGLEQDKILGEYRGILGAIGELLAILTDPDRLLGVIRDELEALKADYNDPRRTDIQDDHQHLSLEDLIGEEDVVVTLSHTGYVKAQPLSSYRAQRRGGRGRSATSVKEADFIDKLFIANTHDTMLCFSNRGRMYWKKVYELPQAGPSARGKPIVNLLPLESDERINAVVPIRTFDADHFAFFATASGTVKKTPLSEFSRPRPSGIIAIDLRPDDQLVGVAITDGKRDIVLCSDAGKALRFAETEVRAMGRAAAGVRGMRLLDDQRVIALIVVEEGDILTVTANGYGKRTPVEDYPRRSRGGQGVISIQTSPRNGPVTGAVQVDDLNEVMLITNAGTLVRTRAAEISKTSRNTQGVKLIALHSQERLIGVERVEADTNGDTNGDINGDHGEPEL